MKIHSLHHGFCWVTVLKETLEKDTLADWANDHKFAKVSNTLFNNINIQIRPSLFHQMCFCSEFTKVCTHQSFLLYGIDSV